MKWRELIFLEGILWEIGVFDSEVISRLEKNSDLARVGKNGEKCSQKSDLVGLHGLILCKLLGVF